MGDPGWFFCRPASAYAEASAFARSYGGQDGGQDGGQVVVNSLSRLGSRRICASFTPRWAPKSLRHLATAYSDAGRTPIPIHIGQAFQLKSDTGSD